jgi:hypothetical protein
MNVSEKSKKMAVDSPTRREGPKTYSARLWPGDGRRMREVMEYIDDCSDGAPASIADAIRWMLAMAMERIHPTVPCDTD